MDHDDVREALELAAAEPGGLDRLMAGDTATAMAVVGHLVGCEACTIELERVRRVSGLVREVVASTLAPDLRDRTLAHVRAHGIPRGTAPGAPESVISPASSTPTPLRTASRPSRRALVGWVATVAAAVVLSVVVTSSIVGGRIDDGFASQGEAIRDLANVTNATLHLTAEADVARVDLDSPNPSVVSGTLLFSPSTTDLVVVATGLVEPPAGMQYRCWMDRGNGRQGIGRMFFGGGLAYWVGPSPAVSGSTGPVTFGVSLVGADGAPSGPDPVLEGSS